MHLFDFLLKRQKKECPVEDGNSKSILLPPPPNIPSKFPTPTTAYRFATNYAYESMKQVLELINETNEKTKKEINQLINISNILQTTENKRRRDMKIYLGVAAGISALLLSGAVFFGYNASNRRSKLNERYLCNEIAKINSTIYKLSERIEDISKHVSPYSNDILNANNKLAFEPENYLTDNHSLDK